MCIFFGQPEDERVIGKQSGGHRAERSSLRVTLDGSALDEAIHTDLSTALFEGRLTPGSKLPEHRLAAIFGVSRERIRKVLHRLVAERRLEAVPQRGTFVPQPTAEEIRTIYQAHRVFEAGIVAQLVTVLDDAIMARIDAHLAQERAAAARGDRATSIRLSGGFHLLLVDALGNAELSRFLRELLSRSSLMVSAYEPARLSPCGVDEHTAIAEALRARATERAVALSREHFVHIEDRLAQGIVERGEQDLEAIFQRKIPSTTSRRQRSEASKARRTPAGE
jgi:DNA-binding GntR family transcriptional regulator